MPTALPLPPLLAALLRLLHPLRRSGILRLSWGRGSTCPELAEWIRRPRRNAMRGPPVQAAPVPSIPAESLPQPAPDSIRGTRSGAGTQQQPLRPAPRCHPDLPTSQPLDPSQQPAPSPHAIPRPRPPLHPHHPSAQPSSPPKKSAKSRTRRPGTPLRGSRSAGASTPINAPSPHPIHPKPTQPTPNTVAPQTRQKRTPPRLKSFLEKTLPARETPNPATSTPPSQTVEEHPATRAEPAAPHHAPAASSSLASRESRPVRNQAPNRRPALAPSPGEEQLCGPSSVRSRSDPRWSAFGRGRCRGRAACACRRPGPPWAACRRRRGAGSRPAGGD